MSVFNVFLIRLVAWPKANPVGWRYYALRSEFRSEGRANPYPWRGCYYAMRSVQKVLQGACSGPQAGQSLLPARL
jgi:hypothetical protein